MRDAFGTKDTGSSGQAIRFLAAGSQKPILNQIEYRTIHSNSGEDFRKSDIILMFLDVFRQKLDIF
jgi:hypothetical protein